MKLFLCALATTVAGALAAGTPSAQGIHDGYFYSWSTDNEGVAYYTNQDAGTYNVKWSSSGRFVGGKGWSPGSWGRVINYNGTCYPISNTWLSVYGWTRNPLIEYHIVESTGYGGIFIALSGRTIGSIIACNGARYNVSQTANVDQPSIDGTQTFQTFWSVRTPSRAPGGAISGTVDTGCHFDGWKRLGMQLSDEFAYQIMATEGFYSSGDVTIIVS
ncbi:xylanase A [Coprinopsis sp. MPI-PUGE-AT-0042]|nr:xylanase A [Coprinopsis sp. MPI-PUGE-AT-0042]